MSNTKCSYCGALNGGHTLVCAALADETGDFKISRKQVLVPDAAPKVIDRVAPGKGVHFLCARRGALIYQCDDGFKFEVPLADMGNGEFLPRDKAITFMRWIRKAMQAPQHHVACVTSVTGGLEGPCDCGVDAT